MEELSSILNDVFPPSRCEFRDISSSQRIL